MWSVLGGIAHATNSLRIGTGVTCPTMRYHPAILAQAVATIGSIMPRLFSLGLGSGERLNEHVVGDHWPPVDVRQEMLEEAVGTLRLLWKGGYRIRHGHYFTVENARIYTLPEELPQIMVAAAGPKAAELAGRIGDGLISIAPDEGLCQAFEASGGKGKPRYGQLHVCSARDDETARQTAREWWPNVAIKGALGQELALPMHFEQASEMVSEDDVAKAMVCSSDAGRHIPAIDEYVKAGFDHVFIHQVGPDQEGFFRFYEQEVLPELSSKVQ